MKRLFFIPLLLVSLLASYSQSSLGPNANIIGSNIFISKTGYFGGIVITNPAGTIVGNGSGLTGVVGTASNLIDATNETARVATQTTNHANALSVNGSNDVLRVGQLGTNYTLAVGANGTNHIALATNTLATALSNNLTTLTATIGTLTVTNIATNVNVSHDFTMTGPSNSLTLGDSGRVRIGYQAGLLSTNIIYTVQIGDLAGYNSGNAYQAVQIGRTAGFNSSNAPVAVQVGYEAGYNTANAEASTQIGPEVGYRSTNAPYVFQGAYRAGFNAVNATQSVMLGTQSGFNATNANDVVFVGPRAGYNAFNSDGSVIIGLDAGHEGTLTEQSVEVGSLSGYNATNAFGAVLIGREAGYNATESVNAVAVGRVAAHENTNNTGSTMVGAFAGYDSPNRISYADSYVTYVGFKAGRAENAPATGITNAIGIGANTKVPESNMAVIGPTNILKTLLRGNVGIGSTNPAAALDIEVGDTDGLTQAESLRLGPRIGTDRAWRFMSGKAGDAAWGAYSLRIYPQGPGNTGDYVVGTGGGDFRVGTGQADLEGMTNGFDESFVVAASGYVGIDMPTPSEKLSVIGNILATNSANSALTIQPTETNVLLNVGSPSVVATAMAIGTNASVGIGTNLPQTKLHVADPTTANGDVAMRVSNDAQSWDWVVQGSSNDYVRVYDLTYGKYPLGIAPGSSNDMVVVNGGQVGIGTNAPNALLHLFRQTPIVNEVLFKISTTNSGGDPIFTIDEDGDVVTDGSIEVSASSFYYITSRLLIKSYVDQTMSLSGYLATNFNRLVFGTNDFRTNTINRYASLSFSNALFNTTPIMSVTAQDGQAPCDFRVSGDAHVTNSLTVLRSVTATNFVFSTPRWVDALASGMALRVGGSSPVRTEVEAGTGIYGTGFDDNEDSDFSIQFPHVCAATNAAFPQFWYEPHVHISVPSASIGAGESNCTFVISYSIAAPGITFSNSVVTMTNTLTITHPFMHHMLEFGHVTNNALQGTISAVVQGNLKRLPSATGNIGGRVIVDSLDYHVPIHMVGSSQESSN